MRKTKKDKNRLPPFVAIFYTLLDSKAYKELSHSTAHALPYFFRKVKLNQNHPEYYTTDFEFSYTEAEKAGFSRATFNKIIKELVEVGFIDPLYKGGLRGDKKSCSRFTLSIRWKDYGTDKHEAISWSQFIGFQPF